MTSRTANAGSRVARRPRSSLLLLLSLALAASCATAPPREPVSEDARRALALLESRASEFTDLRALANIALKRGRERQNLRGVLLVKAPSSIRFEALGPFGPPILIVTVHEGQLTAYDAVRNEAHVGPASAERISKALGLPLDPEDLVAVLAGRVAPQHDMKSAELAPPDDAGPSLNLVSSAGRRRVWLDLETGTVRQLEIYGSPFNALVRYRRDGAGALAGFDLEAAQSYVTGSVTYETLVEGAGIDPERFIMAIPKGAKTQSIR
jgi:outer membrane lipoprotein-sorting protein